MAICSILLYRAATNALKCVYYIVIAHLVHFHDFSLNSNVIYKVLI